MSAKARVRLEAVGADKLRQALSGIERQSNQANRRQTQGIQRRRRDEITALDAVHTEHEKNARRAAKTDRDMHQRKLRYIREEAREEQQSQRLTERNAQQARRRAARRTFAASVAGAAFGAGRAAMQTVSGARQTFGLRSGHDELLTDSMALQRGALTLDAQRELASGTSEGRIHRIAAATGVQQSEVLAADETIQRQFASQNASFDDDTLRGAAEISRALNTPLRDIVTLMGLFGQNLDNLDGSQILELFNVITAIGNVGSIDAGSLSQSLAPNIGEFARATGIEDPVELAAGVARMGTLIKQGGQSDSETSTMMSSLLRSVNDPRVVQRYNRATGRRGNASPFHEGGDINGRLNLDMLISALGDEGLNRTAIASIFTNETSQGAAGVIRDASTNETLMRDMNNATAADGAAFIADVNERFDGQAFGRMEHQRAQNLATFNPDNAFSSALEEAAGYFSELEAEFPEVIGGLKLFGEAVTNIAGTLLGMKMLGVGGATAAAGGGAAAAGGMGLAALFPAVGAGMGLGALGDYLTEGLTGMSATQRVDAARNGEEQVYSPFVHELNERFFGGGGSGSGGGGAMRSGGGPVTVRMDPDTTRALGDATASALTTQSRRQEGGAARRGGS